MNAGTLFPNRNNIDRQRYRSILRICARLVLGGALTVGTAACARIQHVAAEPVGAIADSITGAENKKAAPVAVDVDKLINNLKHGGYVIVFRHAPTNRDQSDSDPLNYSDTAHQRLLSDKGVELATRIGYAVHELGIPVGRVYTSKFSRAIETGKLIGGDEVTTTIDVTEGGLVATPIENDRRAAALRALVATPPTHGTNIIIVTHKPNLIDAFGADWVSSKDAEASVFKPGDNGSATLVGRLQAQDWINAAAGAVASGSSHRE